MNFGVEKLTDKYTSGKEKNQVALSLLNSTHSNVSFPRKIYFKLEEIDGSHPLANVVYKNFQMLLISGKKKAISFLAVSSLSEP